MLSMTYRYYLLKFDNFLVYVYIDIQNERFMWSFNMRLLLTLLKKIYLLFQIGIPFKIMMFSLFSLE